MSLPPWQQRVAQELGKGYDISFTPNVLKKQPKDKLFICSVAWGEKYTDAYLARDGTFVYKTTGGGKKWQAVGNTEWLKLFNELKLQMRGSVADAANQRMPLVAEL